MRAPIDKIPPAATAAAHNDIVQIIVTTACDVNFCSNCTQLLPHRRDKRTMSPAVFREALESLREWPGVVAMFGGNPCIHPQFEELCGIMEEVLPQQRRRGLWTNNLLGKGGAARRTFWPAGRFNLNVHCDEAAAAEMHEWLPGIPVYGRGRPSWHSPILLDWRDLGLSEVQWIERRERCDVNRLWSAAVAERDGRPWAYFCEIGASLDGVRGENNGILAEPGWWRWPMERFRSQVAACCDRGCGVPLKFKGHLDSDETYDASASMARWLRTSSRAKLALVSGGTGGEIREVTDYQRLKE